MSITQSYLQHKAKASHDLFKRMSGVHDAMIGKEHVNNASILPNVRDLLAGLNIKKTVIDVLVNLYDADHTRTTDNVFKAINSAMYHCAQAPEKSNNKIMQPLFKANLNREQMNSMASLLDVIRSQKDKEKRTLVASRMLGQFVRERSSRLSVKNIENIVLAGGGAKGFSLSKVPSALESKGVDNIKRIAGTSAGAILGSMMAFGYSGKELENVVLSNQFGLFTVDSQFSVSPIEKLADKFPVSILKPFSDNGYAKEFHRMYLCEQLMSAAKLGIELPLNIQNEINDLYEKHYIVKEGDSADKVLNNRRKVHGLLYKHFLKPYCNDLLQSKALMASLLNLPEHIRQDASGIATQMTEVTFNKKSRYFTQLYETTEQATRFAVREISGQDLIVSFFEDLIEDKINLLSDEDKRTVFLGSEFKHDTSLEVPNEAIRRVNFIQLKKLHEMHPAKFKEFYCTIALDKKQSPKGASSSGVRYDHHDISHQHASLSKMAVADAVRVSMNLPVVYRAFKFEVEGKTYSGADGGVLSNLSIHVFDDQFPPEKSMCFIYATDKELSKAENLYQILVHPRSRGDINKDIADVRIEIKELSEKRAKFTRIVNNQEKKSNQGNQVMVGKMILEAKNRASYLTERIDKARFKRQVLDYEVDNAKTRSWLPFKVSDILANKRHRGQYLPQDLNRTVLINTGDVGTLDFKIDQAKKHSLMKSGERSVNEVLSGRDDIELSFLREKCEEYEMFIANQKLSRMSNSIWNRIKTNDTFRHDAAFVFQEAYINIKDKSRKSILQKDIEDTLSSEDTRDNVKGNNPSLALARNMWRDALTYHSDVYRGMNL